MKLRYIQHFVAVMLLLAAGNRSFAQDPTFSQFNLNQFYYNPAYTGDHRGYQVAATYRTQWPNVPGKVFPGPLSTYYGLFDAYLESGQSYTAGAGIFAMQNIEGEGFLKTTGVGISYAQHFAKIGKRTDAVPRIQLSLGFKTYVNSISVNWDKLVFSDQIDIEHGITGQSSIGQSGIGQRFTADLDAGLLMKNNFQGKDKWYNEMGFSMAHLLNPSLSLTGADDENSRLPRKYTGNYRTSVSLKDNRFYIGGTIVFEKQKNFYELNTGADLYINPTGRSLVVPLWFSLMHRMALASGVGNTNAIIASARYKWIMGKETKTVYYAGFTVDVPYSGLQAKSKGAYELSAGVVFPRKGKNYFSKCPHGTF